LCVGPFIIARRYTYAIAAIRLLVLTRARLREVLHAKWEYVALERGMIFLPRSKTGKKPIYLSSAAAEILASLPRLADNPYVFPGEKSGRPRIDLHKPWEAVRHGADLKGVRLHDLRHSFASVGAGGSLGLPIIAAGPFPGLHNAALCASGRRPDVARGRDDRIKNYRGDEGEHGASAVLIRIAITPAAFEAIAATLPLGSVGFQPQISAKGERLIWIETPVVKRLTAMVVGPPEQDR
jgi:hypothetical protein